MSPCKPVALTKFGLTFQNYTGANREGGCVDTLSSALEARLTVCPELRVDRGGEVLRTLNRNGFPDVLLSFALSSKNIPPMYLASLRCSC